MRDRILNRAHKQQINDFSNMRMGTIVPTDLDGLIDYHNKLWIVFEAKYQGATLPYGQRLALERLVDDLGQVKPSIGLILYHTVKNPHDDIDIAQTMVVEYRYKGAWLKPVKPTTAREAVLQMCKMVDE